MKDLGKYIGSKIKQARENNDMTQSELADKLETTRQSISRYENGNRKANQDLLFKLSDIFNVTIDYFFPQSDEYIPIEYLYNQLSLDNQSNAYNYIYSLLDEQNQYALNDTPVIYDYTDVVLSGYVAAGTGNYVDDVKETVSIPTSYLPKGNYDVMVKVNGDSMEPAFLDGDYIFIKCVDEFPNGKFAVVIINNEAFLKKVYKEDNQLRLVSLNSKYSDMYFDETDDIKIVGTVVN